MRHVFRSTVALALVLGFNAGMRAAPVCDDDSDTALVNQTDKPAKESFGERMAHARAAKETKGPKIKHARKAKAAKAPKIPRTPKTARLPD
jgi:hypothetical protein